MLIQSLIAAVLVANTSATHNSTDEYCWGTVMPNQSCGYGSICFGPDGWDHPEWQGCMICEEVGIISPDDCDQYFENGLYEVHVACLTNCFGDEDPEPTIWANETTTTATTATTTTTTETTAVYPEEECWGKVMPDQSCGYGSICFGPNGWNHTEWEGCMTCEYAGVFSLLDCMIFLENGDEEMYNGCMINCFGDDNSVNLNPTLENLYDYQVILDNAADFMEFRFQAPEFTNDIHLGFSASPGHNDPKWEIVIGGWYGTRSVIRTSNQTPHLGVATVVHSREVYDELRKEFFVKVQDGRIAIHHSDNGQMGDVFMEYKSMNIIKDQLQFLLASGGFGGRGSMQIEPHDDVVDNVFIMDHYNYQVNILQ